MRTVIRVYYAPRPLRERGQDFHILIECLRYMGILSVKHDDDGFKIFDVFPPRDVVKSAHKHWAESNVARMKTFGVVAEVKNDLDPVELSKFNGGL